MGEKTYRNYRIYSWDSSRDWNTVPRTLENSIGEFTLEIWGCIFHNFVKGIEDFLISYFQNFISVSVFNRFSHFFCQFNRSSRYFRASDTTLNQHIRKRLPERVKRKFYCTDTFLSAPGLHLSPYLLTLLILKHYCTSMSWI